ncbi:hypothetical protein DFR49_0952 [Hephaestia caeni]|uniref:Uncharacterized protein n=1 Tax=Hephaestia caeni TaxID=645617 RepID=A0A397PL53_9SPHN|nr:hypothetical protein [Hephaestia caeni]RIA46411.1 hypothetical protein DFR49_0952 [Hephaestia caeni]
MNPSIAQGAFVIATRAVEGGLLFWNDEDGFVDLDQATVFSEAEMRECSMPIADDPPRWLALPSRRRDASDASVDSVLPNRARFELLDRVYALMSEYLADECPDDEHWEDFDTDIDRFRSEIADLQEQEAAYLAALPAQPSRFFVEIEFLSDREPFATETYEVDAFDWTDAKRAAFRRADDSPYDNDRIPALDRRALDQGIY